MALFPVKENYDYLLDSLDHMILTYEDDGVRGGPVENYPYSESFGGLMLGGGRNMLTSLRDRLSKNMNDKQLELLSWNFDSFYRLYGGESMNRKEKAALIRIMANSIIGVSTEKDNLLKIAKIIDDRSGY